MIHRDTSLCLYEAKRNRMAQTKESRRGAVIRGRVRFSDRATIAVEQSRKKVFSGVGESVRKFHPNGRHVRAGEQNRVPRLAKSQVVMVSWLALFSPSVTGGEREEGKKWVIDSGRVCISFISSSGFYGIRKRKTGIGGGNGGVNIVPDNASKSSLRSATSFVLYRYYLRIFGEPRFQSTYTSRTERHSMGFSMRTSVFHRSGVVIVAGGWRERRGKENARIEKIRKKFIGL